MAGATFSTLRVGETIEVKTTAVNQDGGAALESAENPLAWHAQSEPFPVSATVTAPSVTTAIANALILLLGFTDDDGTAGVFSGSGSPSEFLDDNTALGLDAGIFGDSFLLAVAGTVAARTATYSASTPNVGVTLAITPFATGASVSSVGTRAKVASGNLTPGEPAGASSGDLLLAILVQRDNVVATMSSDWTQILGVNHVVRTGEESRVSIWWCRRGGSAPSYLITRASGNTGLAAAIRIIDAIDTGSPVHRLAVSSKVSVLQDVSASDRQEAFITGLFPGTDAAVYDWNDALTGTGTETQAVTVIDASRIGFSLPELVFDGSNGVALDPITVTAFGLDARDDTPATPYTLTDTLWTIQGGTGVVAFSGPVATATGVTVVVEPVARGTTTIVVTANNQQGQTITGTLTVEVLTAYDVTLSIV